jgi:hypothetical protein
MRLIFKSCSGGACPRLSPLTVHTILLEYIASTDHFSVEQSHQSEARFLFLDLEVHKEWIKTLGIAFRSICNEITLVDVYREWPG